MVPTFFSTVISVCIYVGLLSLLFLNDSVNSVLLYFELLHTYLFFVNRNCIQAKYSLYADFKYEVVNKFFKKLITQISNIRGNFSSNQGMKARVRTRSVRNLRNASIVNMIL